MGTEEPREYTLRFKTDDVSWSGQNEQWVELEDMTDYTLEEDRENVNKYIEQLQHRIRELKVEIEHTRGRLQAWREMWQIYNR